MNTNAETLFKKGVENFRTKNFIEAEKIFLELKSFYPTNKDILKQLGSYKRINIDDDLIKCKSSCPICLDNYKDKEYKRTLKCGHTFHKKCIDKWIKKHNSCPICRKCCLDI